LFVSSSSSSSSSGISSSSSSNNENFNAAQTGASTDDRKEKSDTNNYAFQNSSFIIEYAHKMAMKPEHKTLHDTATDQW